MSYKPPKDREELRNNADAMLARMALPDHAELSEIVARVAALTGKRIDVEPLGDGTAARIGDI